MIDLEPTTSSDANITWGQALQGTIIVLAAIIGMWAVILGTVYLVQLLLA